FNKETLKVQQQQYQADSLRLIRSQALVDSGMIPSGDLFDIKATLATDKQRMVQAEYALLVSKMSLAQLMQLNDFDTFDIADVSYDFQPNSIFFETPQTIFNKAREMRTELKIAQNNVQVAQQDIE